MPRRSRSASPELKPKGETPIAAALEQAIRSFAALKGQSNRVVLVTDGIEECGGDVCAAAQTVADAGLDLRVDVVGFTLTEKQTIRCIPEKTGGQYYEANNATGLTAAFNEVTQ
jgi:Ca-activated chloride channel family protein